MSLSDKDDGESVRAPDSNEKASKSRLDKTRRRRRRWGRVALVLLLLLALSQTPFIYRRYRLGRLHETIVQLNAGRVVAPLSNDYTDYKGVMHVHSMLGGHSTGNFQDIIKAANANQLAFVVMTEHPAPDINTSEMTLKDFHAGVLYINGNEVSSATHDRFLFVPGSRLLNNAGATSTQEVLTQEKTKDALAFVAYPQEFHGWDANGYDGVEVYNLFTNARGINYFTLFFDGLWSYGSYPELLFTTFYERPNDNLKLWDDAIAKRHERLVATAGNDAHDNIGVSLGDETGKKWLQIKLDPYERSFRIVRNHVFIEQSKPLTTDSLLVALAQGHSYIAFDLLCDATGFGFVAENGIEKKMLGDEIELKGGVRLTVATPVKSRVLLIKDGQVIREEAETTRKAFPINEKGVYRVEAYLDQLPQPLNRQPWIISNPIYVR
jgi:hypothetical protein